MVDTSHPMRERILDATLECMREHGVGAATTKMIARHAGVSEGSIYNHFTNRSELVVAAFRQATRGVRDRALGLRTLVGTNSVEDNLVGVMTEAIDFLRGILPVAGSVIGDPALREWFSETQESPDDLDPVTPLLGVIEIARYLESESVEGRVPSRDVWIPAASMLSGACLQYVYAEFLSPSGVLCLDSGEERSEQGYARSIVRALLGTPEGRS